MPQTPTIKKIDPFVMYKTTSDNGAAIYAAGFPSYPANFSRDTIVAGILAGHAEMLASQLEISAQHQGVVTDALTGEQPGRIHHEMPGAQLKGRNGYTTYNACDTTALFLIGAEALHNVDKEKYDEFFANHYDALYLAVQYLLTQVDSANNLFKESPPDGADRFTLRVTYWKDSILPQPDGKVEPVYPVYYALAHFMAARGILSAARILNKPELVNKADEMFQAGIHTFITPDHFTVYKDAHSELQLISSDELHSLAYIPLEYAHLLPLEQIAQRSYNLATPFGYMCTPTDVADQLIDDYHGDKVWVFEQALIDYGARKFNLVDQSLIAQSITPFIGDGQELFGVKNGCLYPEGNSQQLWSVATTKYFSGDSLLHNNQWL